MKVNYDIIILCYKYWAEGDTQGQKIFWSLTACLALKNRPVSKALFQPMYVVCMQYVNKLTL